MRRIWIWFVLLGLILLFVFVGVLPRIHNAQELREEADAQKNRQELVTVTSVSHSDDSTGLLLPGQIMPFRETPVYARTQGFLKRRFVDIGSKVRNGQMLATVEAPELDQELIRARADVRLAQSNLDRLKSVSLPGAISQQDLDNRQATYEMNQANLLRLEALKALQEIRAPFNGIITARNAEVGNLVSTGSGGAIPMFTISQLDTLRVYVDVPQTYYQLIKIGMTASINVPELNKTFTGKVVRTSGTLRTESRTLLAEVAIPNRNQELVSGLYGQVKFSLNTIHPPVLIPANTLLVTSEGPRIVVVQPNRVLRFQPITLGRDFGTTLEVLDGLKGQEQVVTNPNDRLKDGQQVRIKVQEQASATKQKV
ncbi:efflux RND transporter periplasmic adaptor subunit [Larkinella punicea]|uniref:Efflux RND transporter periplasmic adaptor subunit n=1 Tax=Larkinella punicea TaxID=2315727 RepID=A0A368JFU8_9BACT|nr:efflux RND transporter periplasmic adaptor subunit [Larkinella punicea]RCR66538.1 efflux RND transporter periplasmic adaptor subunit [Larkinella punicea]